MRGHGLLIWPISKLLARSLRTLIIIRKKKFLKDATHYVWDDPYLFKVGADGLLRRCVAANEAKNILWHCHNSAYGGHYNGQRTAVKVLQSGFYWPTLFKDAHFHV